MSANTQTIQLVVLFVVVLYSALLPRTGSVKSQISSYADTAGEWSLDLKKSLVKFGARAAGKSNSEAPPYKLTSQQMEDYEAIMSAGEDMPSDSVAYRNRTKGQMGDEYVPEDTRSFLCLPIMRIFTVDVRRVVIAGERVAVVGDHARLGAWQVERAVVMTPSGRDNGVWSAKVAICANARIHYRYFIFSVDRYGRRRVHEWEGVPYGRVLEQYQMYRPPGKDQFGLLSHMTVGDVEHEKGWLRHEYAIEFKFIWDQHMKFYPYMHLNRATKFLLKMSVSQNGFELSPSAWRDTELEVSHYAYNRSQFKPQTERGVPYIAGDVVIFRFTAALNTKHSYQLSVFTADGDRVGEALILSLDLRGGEGVLTLPIQGAVNGFQVGALTLPYVIIRPLVDAADYNLRGSFQRYWPMNWPSVDIGHRGIGASYNADAPLMENTLASFLYAHRFKAEMVELDVQLTRDYVPIVWHDFGFKTAPKGRFVESVEDLDYVLIKDLTYEQLKSRRVFAVEDGDIYEYTNYNARNASEMERLFVTLREIFQILPSTLGLDIEIKWPQPLVSGALEAAQTLRKNRFVDTILKTTGIYGCGRPLFFSSFDADICTMLRLKQNVFPVAFVTIGETRLWEPFKDLRTRSYLSAVNFAQSANLLGTVPHAEDFLQHGALLDFGLDLGQATFVWGDELQDARIVEQFKRWHVSGVIYDRIDLYGPRRKRERFFSAPELLDIFTRQCIVVGHSNCSSEFALPDGFDLHGKPVSRLGCEVIVQQIG
ncbi:PREDICTED: glycerophosphocholine phosphodiesterase GPCPD1-like [Bactrocera latifrons]|uniref:glycerophosphocholine phosphodiesterase GPCPD1-like n=1 Tax=Bactrocera latifrons TaxID=174628 RepID=UPI0008DE0727|nr:PREDICTED: glycerophosphocholine phosphodiesterase GPCPD1-like [Bactrocera latifrons]